MDLYQELILDHSKHPQHAGLRDPFDAEVHHVNTSCGDEITLRVRLGEEEGRQVVEDVSYDALGCSISVASTSILAEETIGHPVPEVMETYEAMKAMLMSRGQDSGDEEVIGDGVALAGVSQYPARVKCALLSWSALLDAMARAGADAETGAGQSEQSTADAAAEATAVTSAPLTTDTPAPTDFSAAGTARTEDA